MIDYVLLVVEIIDLCFFGFKFDLVSVIVDNGFLVCFVGGGCVCYVEDIDLCMFGVVMEKNGEIVIMGVFVVVFGYFVEVIVMLVNILGELGEELLVGSFVMSGGIIEVVVVKLGDSIVVCF